MKILRRPKPAPIAAPRVRPQYPCGVGDCYELQAIVRQDEHETVVECPLHGCATTWDTTPREAREQKIIRPSDTWRQYGTKGEK